MKGTVLCSHCVSGLQMQHLNLTETPRWHLFHLKISAKSPFAAPDGCPPGLIFSSIPFPLRLPSSAVSHLSPPDVAQRPPSPCFFCLGRPSCSLSCPTPAPTHPSHLQRAHLSGRPTPCCVVLAQTPLYVVSSLGTTLFSVVPVPSAVTANAK